MCQQEQDRLLIAVPSGIWSEDVLGVMQSLMGVPLKPAPRCGFVRVGNLPFDLALVRAGSIPSLVNGETFVHAGITGSDIIWENSGEEDGGELFPLHEFHPQARRSSLYLGVADDFYAKNANSNGGKFDPEIMSGLVIATKYPNITGEVLPRYRVFGARIHQVSGSDEVMPRIIPECVGIVGIISTGATARENGIIVHEAFHPVNLRLISNRGKMNYRQNNLFDDLRDTINIMWENRRSLRRKLRSNWEDGLQESY